MSTMSMDDMVHALQVAEERARAAEERAAKAEEGKAKAEEGKAKAEVENAQNAFFKKIFSDALASNPWSFKPGSSPASQANSGGSSKRKELRENMQSTLGAREGQLTSNSTDLEMCHLFPLGAPEHAKHIINESSYTTESAGNLTRALHSAFDSGRIIFLCNEAAKVRCKVLDPSLLEEDVSLANGKFKDWDDRVMDTGVPRPSLKIFSIHANVHLALARSKKWITDEQFYQYYDPEFESPTRLTAEEWLSNAVDAVKDEDRTGPTVTCFPYSPPLSPLPPFVPSRLMSPHAAIGPTTLLDTHRARDLADTGRQRRRWRRGGKSQAQTQPQQIRLVPARVWGTGMLAPWVILAFPAPYAIDIYPFARSCTTDISSIILSDLHRLLDTYKIFVPVLSTAAASHVLGHVLRQCR